jgi:hypothetical protein
MSFKKLEIGKFFILQTLLWLTDWLCVWCCECACNVCVFVLGGGYPCIPVTFFLRGVSCMEATHGLHVMPIGRFPEARPKTDFSFDSDSCVSADFGLSCQTFTVLIMCQNVVSLNLILESTGFFCNFFFLKRLPLTFSCRHMKGGGMAFWEL